MEVVNLINISWCSFVNPWNLFLKIMSRNPSSKWVAERKHHHLNKIAHAFLIEASMPATFWVDAIQTTMFITTFEQVLNIIGSRKQK